MTGCGLARGSAGAGWMAGGGGAGAGRGYHLFLCPRLESGRAASQLIGATLNP